MCWPAVLLLLLPYHKTNRLSGLDYALRSAGARVASTARLWGAQQKARQLQPLTLATLSTHLLRACSSPLRRARPWPRPRARARRSSRPLRRRSRLTAPSAARQRRRLRSTLRCATRCALPTPPRLLRSAALTQSARLHTRAPTCSRDGWQYHASARALLLGAVFRPAALAPLRGVSCIAGRPSCLARRHLQAAHRGRSARQSRVFMARGVATAEEPLCAGLRQAVLAAVHV